MIDAVVATGASIVDMDFFEALGFTHYQAAGEVDWTVSVDATIARAHQHAAGAPDTEKGGWIELQEFLARTG